jgi:hypothetical protein
MRKILFQLERRHILAAKDFNIILFFRSFQKRALHTKLYIYILTEIRFYVYLLVFITKFPPRGKGGGEVKYRTYTLQNQEVNMNGKKLCHIIMCNKSKQRNSGEGEMGRRGRVHIVVGFTTNYAISHYYH